MKLVLKKQVGGVMEQQQQLPPELMQLLMSLPKDIQQYVLSLPIEQQVQELTILMQNQLKALQQSPNQNIQRSINQQPQMSQQQQVPQQLAQQQAMKYGGKKLQGGGDVTSQAGKLVKLWSEDGKSFTWHNTKENGKPDIGNTIDVGNNDTFEYNGKLYDVTDSTKTKDKSENSKLTLGNGTTQKAVITNYENTVPVRVSSNGADNKDTDKNLPIQANETDGEVNFTNSSSSSKEINPLFGVYVYNGLHLDRYGNDPTKLKTAFEGELNDIISVDNYINRLMKEKNINATYNTEDAIMSIKKTPEVINHYKDLFKKIGLEDKIINEWENRLIKSGIYNGSNLSKNQTGGKLSIDSLINQQLQQKAKSQPISNNVVLNTSKPKSIGEKVANAAEFIDKWGTVAGLLGQAADDGIEGWSKEEIAAAVVGNAVDLFNPFGKLGMLMKGVKGVSKLAKIAKVAGAGVNAFNTVSNIANVGDQVYKSKDAFSQGNYGEGIGRAGLALLLGNQVPKNVRGSKDDIIEGSKMIYDKTGKALNAGKELVKESASTVKRVAVETAPKVKRGMSYLADSQLDEYQKLFGKIKSGLKQADEDLAEVGKNKTMNPKIKLAKSKNKPSEVENSKIINLVLGIPSNISDAAGRAALNVSGKVNRGIQAVRDFRLRPEKIEVPDDSKKIVLSSTLSNPTDMSKTVMYGTKLDKVDLSIPSEKELKLAFKEELDRHLKNKGLRPTLKNIDDIAALMLDKYRVPGTNTENRFKEFLTGKYK